MKPVLTQERLRALVDYDPLTGVFTSKVKRFFLAPGDICGTRHSEGYFFIGIDGRRYFSHRLAVLYMTGVWPTSDVDHINGDRADNRWANLRTVSRSVNMQNQKRARSYAKGRTSKYLGVSFDRSRNKWAAGIKVDGKYHYLGRFDSEEKAHEVYVQAKRKHHAGNTL